ncbi:hypothetical protein [Candidatus Megaera venefica]|nr:hypothetical protein [Candidatus Megaera venefica]
MDKINIILLSAGYKVCSVPSDIRLVAALAALYQEKLSLNEDIPN